MASANSNCVEFTPLLTSDWLTTPILDAGILLINRVARQNGVSSLALPLSRWMGIHEPFVLNSNNFLHVMDEEVAHIEWAVQSGILATLWIPVFHEGHHFSVFRIDLCEHMLFYGDSIAWQEPIREHCASISIYIK